MGEMTCKGSWRLGTACGECPRCLSAAPSLAALREERDRLWEALGQIIDCDHHNHSDGPPPRYVQIARAARAAVG